uniref:Chromosome 1 open reading frame 216 n=1 Tax=Podarcis muralis TaxID=64176 RepID=A0A670ITK3_PODMU
MCQPEIPINPLFNEAKGNSQLDTAYLGGRDCRPDTNLNFMGKEAYDTNENWSQFMPGESEQRGGNNEPEASDNQIDVPQGLKSGGMSFERIKERKLASSPLEDNGYASSSLSIDSPDSGAATEPENSPPSSETLFPALAEAFRNLQDKKKFKEQEKEKHHVHLVMYRRLALLRWIRSLQQKVVDQQNRLQESFDTILDNRKELIRCVQQGMGYAKNPAQAEL